MERQDFQGGLRVTERYVLDLWLRWKWNHWSSINSQGPRRAWTWQTKSLRCQYCVGFERKKQSSQLWLIRISCLRKDWIKQNQGRNQESFWLVRQRWNWINWILTPEINLQVYWIELHWLRYFGNDAQCVYHKGNSIKLKVQLWRILPSSYSLS